MPQNKVFFLIQEYYANVNIRQTFGYHAQNSEQKVHFFLPFFFFSFFLFLFFVSFFHFFIFSFFFFLLFFFLSFFLFFFLSFFYFLLLMSIMQAKEEFNFLHFLFLLLVLVSFSNYFYWSIIWQLFHKITLPEKLQKNSKIVFSFFCHIFLMLALFRRTSFLTKSMIYISVIDTHITNYNLSHVGPMWAASMCIKQLGNGIGTLNTSS